MSPFMERGDLGVFAEAEGEGRVETVGFNAEALRGGGRRGV